MWDNDRIAEESRVLRAAADGWARKHQAVLSACLERIRGTDGIADPADRDIERTEALLTFARGVDDAYADFRKEWDAVCDLAMKDGEQTYKRLMVAVGVMEGGQ